MIRTSRQNGVTLLELLIAITLLSLLSAGILTALHAAANAMATARERLGESRRLTGAQRILEQQLAGFIPVMADYQPQAGAAPVRTPFFQGEAQSMRFVSAFSLGEGWRGRPQLLEFQVIPGEGGEGVRLIVNEHLYTGPAAAGATFLGFIPDPQRGAMIPLMRPVAAGPESFVLADRLASCRFSFREDNPVAGTQSWTGRWAAIRWPAAVRVAMTPLDPEGTRLAPLTLTAPIRVTAPPGI